MRKIFYIICLISTLANGQALDFIAPDGFYNINKTSIAYWDFNSPSVDLWDVKSLTHNYQAVATTGLTVGAGKLGNAITFTPARGFTISDNAQLSYGDGTTDRAFSYSFWYYPLEFNIAQYIFSKGNASVKEYECQVMTTSKVRFGVFTDASNSLYAESNGTTTVNTWNFVTVTYDGSKSFSGLKIYINGVAQTTTNVSAGSYTGMSDTAANLFIGNNYNIGAASLGTRGALDEIGLFNYVLTQANTNALYNSGNALAFLSPAIYSETKYVLANRNNFQFATDNNNLYWSSNYGQTWTTKAWGTQWVSNLPIANLWPQFAYIFSDGTLIFGTATTMYRSTDGLATLTNPAMQETDRSTLVVHTPVNASFPGCYFMQSTAAIQDHVIVNGIEMVVWGNYGNVAAIGLGGTPTQLWYSADKGATIRRFYRNGDNASHRDDGTDDGGSTGNTLNDATNPIIVLHWHSIANKPGTNIFYSCSGDATGGENNWFKHVYNTATDTWTTTTLRTSQSASGKWKSTGIKVIGNDIYFVSDGAGAAIGERGIFKGTETDIINDTCIKLYEPGATTLISLQVNSANGKMLTTGESVPYSTGFGLIENFGAGSVKLVPVQGVSTGNVLTKGFVVDNRGYAKINIRGHFTNPIATIFIKL